MNEPYFSSALQYARYEDEKRKLEELEQIKEERKEQIQLQLIAELQQQNQIDKELLTNLKEQNEELQKQAKCSDKQTKKSNMIAWIGIGTSIFFSIVSIIISILK